MINNIEIIKNIMVFESEDDFYYLQILQRKKENELLGSNSRVIKNYYINSLEKLEKYYPEIIQLCNLFNARAMIRLNKRSFSKVAFKTLINISNNMSNADYKNIFNSYDRACGLTHNDKNKTWIIDIDTFEIPSSLIEYIDSLRPIGEKIITKIPSKNGYHLISKPFDLKDFKIKFPDIEIHKDNPTNLYIP